MAMVRAETGTGVFEGLAVSVGTRRLLVDTDAGTVVSRSAR